VFKYNDRVRLVKNIQQLKKGATGTVEKVVTVATNVKYWVDWDKIGILWVLPSEIEGENDHVVI
jgi:hypothetical protein